MPRMLHIPSSSVGDRGMYSTVSYFGRVFPFYFVWCLFVLGRWVFWKSKHVLSCDGSGKQCWKSWVVYLVQYGGPSSYRVGEESTGFWYPRPDETLRMLHPLSTNVNLPWGMLLQCPKSPAGDCHHRAAGSTWVLKLEAAAVISWGSLAC